MTRPKGTGDSLWTSLYTYVGREMAEDRAMDFTASRHFDCRVAYVETTYWTDAPAKKKGRKR